MSALVIAASAVPPQSREAWVAIAENVELWKVVLLVLSLCLASPTLWYWSRWLLDKQARTRSRAIRQTPQSRRTLRKFIQDLFDPRHNIGPALEQWSPRMLGLSPVIGAAMGMLTALYFIKPISVDARLNLMLGTMCCVGLCLALLVLWWARRRLLSHGRFSKLHWVRRTGLGASLCIAPVTIAGFAARPAQIGDYWPPAGLLALFVLVWVPPVSLLIHWCRRSRFPVLTAIAAWVFLWGFIGTNDNHRVDTRWCASKTSKIPATSKSVSSEFAAWLSTRPDLKEYHDRNAPYPVYLVCAEGGGIYAACFTSRVLATLQDANPRFADHVFAISGVSGGSVGATVFASLLAETRGNPPIQAPTPAVPISTGAALARKTYQDAADDIFSANLLSPVLGAALFPDLLARFSFVPIEPFDRALAIEVALERSWRRRIGGDRLTHSFYELKEPYLFLNTTHVETGRRVVITPLDMSDEASGRTLTLHAPHIAPGLDLRLSTAAFLSARFPYITPVASLRTSDGLSMRLADGGYHENHGAGTLLNILNGIGPANYNVSKQSVSIVVIRIGTGTPEPTGHAISLEAPDKEVAQTISRGSRQKATDQWLGELLSPVRTIMNTRSARGEAAINALRFETTKLRAQQVQTAMYDVLLDVEKLRIPLGWHLSSEGRTRLNGQVGTRDPSQPRVGASDESDNSGALQSILRHLKLP